MVSFKEGNTGAAKLEVSITEDDWKSAHPEGVGDATKGAKVADIVYLIGF